jgi:hypothetical protein
VPPRVRKSKSDDHVQSVTIFLGNIIGILFTKNARIIDFGIATPAELTELLYEVLLGSSPPPIFSS